jgi:uncharacterized protein (TIGR00369 family)
MEKDKHYSALEKMYLAAPINKLYLPRIEIEKAGASIEIDIKEDFFHAGGAVHGSVYFKMLDDAAYFAANSLEREVFVLTTSFTTYLTRPVSEGTIRAVGRVVNKNNSQLIVDAVAYDSDDIEIGRGNGVFLKSKTRLSDVPGYQS